MIYYSMVTVAGRRNLDLNSEGITLKTGCILYFHSWSSSKSALRNFLYSYLHLKSKMSNPGQAVSWATQRPQMTGPPASHPLQSGMHGSKFSQSANHTSTR